MFYLDPPPGKHSLAEYEESPGEYSSQFYDAMTSNMQTILVE